MSNTNKQFEELLKSSNFFNSAIESQRIATAEAIALTIKCLVKNEDEQALVIAKIIQDLNQPTNRPSVDGDRHRIAEALRVVAVR